VFLDIAILIGPVAEFQVHAVSSFVLAIFLADTILLLAPESISTLAFFNLRWSRLVHTLATSKRINHVSLVEFKSLWVLIVYQTCFSSHLKMFNLYTYYFWIHGHYFASFAMIIIYTVIITRTYPMGVEWSSYKCSWWWVGVCFPILGVFSPCFFTVFFHPDTSSQIHMIGAVHPTASNELAGL